MYLSETCQPIELIYFRLKMVTLKIKIINQSFKLINTVEYRLEIMGIKFLNRALIIYIRYKNLRLRKELDQLSHKRCKSRQLLLT